MPVFDVNKTNGIEGIRVSYKSALNSIKPDLVAAMGATAAQSVFGKITPINKNRGRPIDLADGIQALAACPGCCAAHPGPRGPSTGSAMRC
jgi:uracil-DNA glycosylase